MSEQLRKYINEWHEEQARPTENFQMKDRELYSIQNAVRSVYESEKEQLTDAEKAEVEEILGVDLSWFI